MVLNNNYPLGNLYLSKVKHELALSVYDVTFSKTLDSFGAPLPVSNVPEQAHFKANANLSAFKPVVLYTVGNGDPYFVHLIVSLRDVMLNHVYGRQMNS